MLKGYNIGGFASGGSTGSAVTFNSEDYDSDTVNRSTYTFSGLSVGAASANRVAVVCGGYRSATTPAEPTSVTIGGTSCSIISRTNTTGGDEHGCFIAWCSLPSGTTASVVVAFSVTHADCDAWLVTFNDCSTTNYSSDTDTSGNDFALATTCNTLVDTITGGVLVNVVTTSRDPGSLSSMELEGVGFDYTRDENFGEVTQGFGYHLLTSTTTGDDVDAVMNDTGRMAMCSLVLSAAS